MILWLLRLFPAYRALKSANHRYRRELAALNREAATLRDANADLRNEREEDRQQIAELIQHLDEARTSEIDSTRLVADQFSFMRFGRTVYGRGDVALPMRPEDHQPIAKTKLQASDVVRIQTQKFKEDFLERERQQTEAAEAFFNAELAAAKEKTA